MSDILAMVQSARVAFDNLEIVSKKNGEQPPVNFEREASFAMQILTNNVFLAKMQPQSIVTAIKNVALCGITLNPAMKLAYLVPRDGKACLDISYMGLVKIATDSGSVINVNCQLVYEKDEFSIEFGSAQKLIHKPDPFKDRGALIGVYTIATMHDGAEMIETMGKADIDNIKKRSKAFASGKKCPWVTDEGEMTRKTCIKRASKYWTKTERLSTAIQVVNEHEGINFNQDDNVVTSKELNKDDETKRNNIISSLEKEAKKGMDKYKDAFSKLSKEDRVLVGVEKHSELKVVASKIMEAEVVKDD